MSEAVMVAVRCRPFNKRELSIGCSCIVEMRGKTTILKDHLGKVPPKEFAFDYSYWSHNKDDSHFADNPQVYKDLGVAVLDNAWNGYNVCLFAYGQTGAGKSYSMVGYGDDKGIVPLAMQELFERVQNNTDPNVKYLVEASMMEIYNEKVRDLFNPAENPPGGLKVRDHPQTGPYVDGLSRNVVSSYKQISKLMDEGTAARTVASTAMNATSSRAHTVFQIVFTTTLHDAETNKDTSKTSKINLVDLAGSERVSKTGAAGDTLKEGIGINKSLTALGDCIEKLAKKSNAPKGKEVHVPYRNSILTWLLKESLGGNAKTIMIAAVSPASDNYDESLSTLRYADRAKQIKNKAVVNEDENAKIIRQLKEEIAKLRAQLGNGGAAASGMTDEERAEYMRLKEQMKQNEELMKQMNMSWEEKLAQSTALAASRATTLGNDPNLEEKKKKYPYMVNLHKDRLMSECLHYFFPPGQLRLCQKQAQPPPGENDIILNGLQIRVEHATITNNNGEVTLTPIEDARCFINGKQVTTSTEIHHNDRIILGAYLVFRVVFPNHASDDGEQKAYDWEYAQKEFTAATLQTLAPGPPPEEMAQRSALEEMQRKIEEEKEKLQRDAERKQAEYDRKLAELEARRAEEIATTKAQLEQSVHAEENEVLKKKLAEREAELEREKKEAERAHLASLEMEKRKQAELEAKLKQQQDAVVKLTRKHENENRDRTLLQENLLFAIPMVNEANAICTELTQPLRFSIKLLAHRSPDADGFTERTDVLIRVLSLEDEDMEVVWSVDTLQIRLDEMRDIYQHFMSHREVIIPKKEAENPFHLVLDGPATIGVTRIYLQPLYFLLSIKESLPIIDYKGEHKGNLDIHLRVVPNRRHQRRVSNLTAEQKAAMLAAEMEEGLLFEEDDISELKGNSVIIHLDVAGAQNIPERLSRNFHIGYSFFLDPSTFQSATCPNETTSPVLKYSRAIVIDNIDDEFVNYCKTGILEIFSYGEWPLKQPKHTRTASTASTTKKNVDDDADDDKEYKSGEEKKQSKYKIFYEQVKKEVKTNYDANAEDKPEKVAEIINEIIAKEKELEQIVAEKEKKEQARLAKKAAKKANRAEAAAGAASTTVASVTTDVASPTKKSKDKETKTDTKADKKTASKKKKEKKVEKKEEPAINKLNGLNPDEKQQELERLKKEMEEQQQEIARIKESEKQLENMRAELEAAKQELEAKRLREEQDAADLAARREKLREQGIDDANDMDLLKAQLASARNKVAIANADERLEELQEEIRKRDAELEALRAEASKKKSKACVIL